MFQVKNGNSYSQNVYASEISIYNNNQMLIDGVQQILVYNRDSIMLSLGKRSVRIQGNCLCIQNMNCHQLKISGDIKSIEFC